MSGPRGVSLATLVSQPRKSDTFFNSAAVVILFLTTFCNTVLLTPVSGGAAPKIAGNSFSGLRTVASCCAVRFWVLT